jgi:hypothetical protein
MLQIRLFAGRRSAQKRLNPKTLFGNYAFAGNLSKMAIELHLRQ